MSQPYTAVAPLSGATPQITDKPHGISQFPCFREAGAGGSNPLTPTNKFKTLEAAGGIRGSPKRQQNTSKTPTGLHRCYTAPRFVPVCANLISFA